MAVFEIIILMVEFFGFALILKRFAGIPLAVTPPVIASSIVLLLYILGFFVSLKPISILIHISGLSAFLFFAYLSIKNYSKSQLNFKKKLPTFAITSSVLFVVIAFYFLNRAGEFRAWDEFSHWGTIIRAIYEANTFVLSPNPLYFQDYVPGTAIFSYHILTLLGFTEGNAYFSFCLLLLCFASPIVGTALNKGIALGGAAFILIFYLVIALGNGWSSVLIDHILSLAFASTIVSYFALQKYARTLIFIPILLSSLVLFKQVGLSLAILAACICSVDWIILRCTQEKNIHPHFKLSLFSYKDITWLLALFLMPVLVSISWKNYVTLHHLQQGWGNVPILEFFKKSMTCCSTPREINVAGNFFSTYFGLDGQYSKGASLGGFLGEALSRINLLKLIFSSANFVVSKVILVLSMLGIVGACFFRFPQSKLRFTLLNIELTVGALLYSASLLLTYLYGFSDYEAGILVSFQRYHNVFLLGWSLILLYMAFELLDDMTTTKRCLLLLVVILAISMWTFASLSGDIISYIKKGAWPASEQRVEVKNFVKQYESNIPKDSSVYISWYGSNGWEFWIIKYELLPRMTNVDCFSLGPKLNADDLWTCEFNPSNLGNYKYFLIGKGLRVLHKKYKTVFVGVPPNVDAGLFKINNSNAGLHLIYLPEREQ